LAFLGAAGLFFGGVAYDHWECKRLKAEFVEKARRLADRPVKDPLQVARHLEMYLSASGRKDVNFYLQSEARQIELVIQLIYSLLQF
jgi:hypothetical protein